MLRTTNMRDLARDLSAAFEEGTRADGSTFRRLRDGRPDWMQDVAREAHGTDADGAPAMLPDDWRYQFIEAAADAIAEADDDADQGDVIDEATRPDDYTHDLLAWVGSHLTRQGYVDDAAAQGTTENVLAAAQEIERREVFAQVWAALEARAVGDADDDDASSASE